HGPPQQQVAHDAAYEVDAPAGRVETLGERLQFGEHGSETVGNHSLPRLRGAPRLSGRRPTNAGRRRSPRGPDRRTSASRDVRRPPPTPRARRRSSRPAPASRSPPPAGPPADRAARTRTSGG